MSFFWGANASYSIGSPESCQPSASGTGTERFLAKGLEGHHQQAEGSVQQARVAGPRAVI